MDINIWNKILHYCAYRERSENEIKNKLIDLGINNEPILLEYLNALKENGIASDSKFIEAYIRGKIRMKKWGPKKIIYELGKKGFNELEIEKKIKPYEEEIYNNCRNILWSEKFNKLHLDDQNEVKIKRYLYSKGYEPEMVLKCLEEIKQKHEN